MESKDGAEGGRRRDHRYDGQIETYTTGPSAIDRLSTPRATPTEGPGLTDRATTERTVMVDQITACPMQAAPKKARKVARVCSFLIRRPPKRHPKPTKKNAAAPCDSGTKKTG